MSKIFISYSSHDKPWVSLLASELINQGYDVWWDIKLLPGEKFEEAIRAALNNAECVVTVWSESSLQSVWVQEESSKALERGVLIPVLHQKVTPPMPFGRIHTGDLTEWDGEPSDTGFQKLLESIDSHIQKKPVPKSQKLKIKPIKSQVPKVKITLLSKLVISLLILFSLGMYFDKLTVAGLSKMELLDPSKILTWISLVAVGLLFFAFVAKLVINSEPIKKVTGKNTFKLLKSTIDKTFLVVFLIVILAGCVTVFDKYINNKMKATASEIQQTQQLLQEWAILDTSDKTAALNSMRLAAYKFETYESFFMYASILSDENKFEESLLYYRKALAVRETKEAYLNLATVEQNLGKLDESLDSLEKGVKTASSLLNSDIVDAKINYNIASVYLDKYQADNQEEFLIAANDYLNLSESKIMSNSALEASFFSLKGLFHELKGEDVKAAKYYLRSVRLKENQLYSTTDFLKLGITYSNASKLLLNNDFEGAKDAAIMAISIFSNSANKIYSAIAYYNLAEAEEKLEDFLNSLAHYEQSKQLFVTSGNYRKFYEDKVEASIVRVKCLLNESTMKNC